MNIKKKIFSILITLYPKPYRQHFRESLLQNFDDVQEDASASEWFMVKDAIVSVPMQYINYFDETMKTKLNRNILIAILGAMVIVLALGINQIIFLQKAHSTFDNYYAFRGCTQLIQRADTYGICKIASGATITIVEINNKWYLQGNGREYGKSSDIIVS